MRGVRQGERVLIVGQTGMGKTTMAAYLAEMLQPIRLVIVDPKRELDLRQPVTHSVTDLPEALRQPICHWMPDRVDRATLEEGFQLIWHTPGPLLVWVDEAALCSSDSWIPEGLRMLIIAGRQGGKMVLACTQRLVECHPVFRSQSEHIIILVPAPIALDLKTIAGHIGREAGLLEHELKSLQAEYGLYSHLWYVRPEDDLRRCAPLPPPWRPAG
jgi:energy-coupling factor transporter ATP-binding protein EcfA2